MQVERANACAYALFLEIFVLAVLLTLLYYTRIFSNRQTIGAVFPAYVVIFMYRKHTDGRNEAGERSVL